jgi:hypothetical protein
MGGTAEAAFDAIDGKIDSMTKTAVFSHYKPNPCEETAKEQRYTNYNFIYSRGRDLRPLNNGFVSARWVSLYTGTDVINTLPRFRDYWISCTNDQVRGDKFI